jgi:hypothetical protein
MDDSQEARARELAEHLEKAGPNCGLLPVQGIVVLRCPGAPYTDTPMITFDEADLQNAVALDLLERGKVVGSYEWEWYVLRKKNTKP